MSGDQTLLDELERVEAERGLTLRDQGRDLALDATSGLWVAEAMDAMRRLAATGREFSADNLHAEMGCPPSWQQGNATGGLFTRACREGLIEHVGYAQATRPAARGRVLRTWRGAG